MDNNVTSISNLISGCSAALAPASINHTTAAAAAAAALSRSHHQPPEQPRSGGAQVTSDSVAPGGWHVIMCSLCGLRGQVRAWDRGCSLSIINKRLQPSGVTTEQLWTTTTRYDDVYNSELKDYSGASQGTKGWWKPLALSAHTSHLLKKCIIANNWKSMRQHFSIRSDCIN